MDRVRTKNAYVNTNQVRYVTGIPRKPLPKGIVLVHNHRVPQSVLGWNGFRAWTQKRTRKLVRCECDWAGVDLRGLRHYRVNFANVRRQGEVMGTENRQRNRTELDLAGLQDKIVEGFVVLNDEGKEGSAVPILDFNSRKLRKGERAPKGWRTVPITAAELPPGWPENRPYACSCGCGITYRVGDRIAFRNLRVVGFGKPKWGRPRKS